MTNIQKILKKIKQLPSIPVVVHKVLASAGDPESPLSELVHIVEHDPAITANLLKICNSAYIGLSVKIDSIQQAVAMLGIKRVAELVLTQGLSTSFKGAQKGYSLAKGALWKQSVATAMLTQTLAERRQLNSLPAIYTAALLKDIGKVVLHEFVAHELDKIQYLVKTKGLSFVEAEKECIGIDHAELGGMIAKEWNFSPEMIFLIENHHLLNPETRQNPVAAALYLADMVAMLVGTCIGVDRLAYHIYEDIFDDYFLTRDELKALMTVYDGYLKGVTRLFDTA